MYRLDFAALFCAMAAATAGQAAETSLLLSEFGASTAAELQASADGQPRNKPYRLTLSLVPVRYPEANRFGPGFSSVSRVSPAVDAQPEVAWAGGDSATRYVDGARAAWLPLLRFETKGERLEFKPRRHSLSIQWTKALD